MKFSKDNTILLKLLAITAFMFIILSLIIINLTGEAQGYEISIYSAYPIYLWVLLILSTSCGISIIVYQAFNERKNSKMWIVGFLAVVLTNVIILLLPIFRDYAIFGRGDVLSHIGYARDIILYGHFQGAGTIGENLYPILHILMVNVNYFSGINLYFLPVLIPIFFYIIYFIFIYLLAKVVTNNNRGKTLLITAFGSVLLFTIENLILIPSTQGFMLLPMVLFLFYKTRIPSNSNIAYGILLVLSLLLIPFFHPGELTLFLIIMLIIIDLSLRFYKKICNNRESPILESPNKNSNIMLLLVVTWAMWFTSFSAFLFKSKEVINWLLYDTGSTNAQLYSSILGQANISTYDFIILFMKMYGQYVLLFILAALICIFIIKKIISNRDNLDVNELTFGSLFIALVLVLFVSFSNWLAFDFYRVLKYVVLVSIFLNGMFLYSIFNNKYKKIGIIFVTALIISSGSIGIFNTFPSPIIKSPNSQVTQMELTGEDWFLEHRDKTLSVDNNVNLYFAQIRRFNHALKGYQYSRLARIVFSRGPDHFNYNNGSNYGDYYNSDWYYVDMKLSRLNYPEIFPEYPDKWRFTPQDFYKLDNNDTTVDTVYSDGEYWVYFIKSTK